MRLRQIDEEISKIQSRGMERVKRQLSNFCNDFIGVQGTAARRTPRVEVEERRREKANGMVVHMMHSRVEIIKENDTILSELFGLQRTCGRSGRKPISAPVYGSSFYVQGARPDFLDAAGFWHAADPAILHEHDVCRQQQMHRVPCARPDRDHANDDKTTRI